MLNTEFWSNKLIWSMRFWNNWFMLNTGFVTNGFIQAWDLKETDLSLAVDLKQQIHVHQ
jgi:hypothetical protein